jgi:hypothetical protein
LESKTNQGCWRWVRGEKERKEKDRTKLNAFHVTPSTSSGANTELWYCPTNLRLYYKGTKITHI